MNKSIYWKIKSQNKFNFKKNITLRMNEKYLREIDIIKKFSDKLKK